MREGSAPATAGPSEAEALERRITELPIWDGAPLVAPLGGGLSNASFVVTDRSGRYAVRFGEDYPFHGVEGSRELTVARAAHDLGFAPEVVYDAPGMMVSRFIDGRVLRADDVRADIKRICALLRRFHTEMDVPGLPDFDVFEVIGGYGVILAPTGRVPELARLLGIAAALEATMPPGIPAFAHHDLLPANLIDDGERLWLIDFEYAGPGNAMFDLGGLSSNAGFSAAECEALLDAYFGAAALEQKRHHAGMACASLLREALWSEVSALHLSAPGADYVGYARENLRRFELAVSDFRLRFGDLPR